MNKKNLLLAFVLSGMMFTSANGGTLYNGGTLNFDSTPGNIAFTGNPPPNPADIYNIGTININGTANDVSTAGGITGTGVINKSNGGSFTVSGDSSGFTGVFNQTGGTTTAYAPFFSGVSTITGGMLNLAQGSAVASTAQISIGGADAANAGTLLISTNGNITLNNLGQAGAANTGTLEKIGSGNLVLTGTTAFSGDMNLAAGATSAGGPISVNNFTLGPGATYDMRNAATTSSVTTAGNFQSSGNIYMEVNASNGAHDSVISNGAANSINAATLYISLISPVKTLTADELITNLFQGTNFSAGNLSQFTIANVANGKALGPGVGARLVPTASGIDLQFYLLSSNLLGITIPDLSHNESEVANALDQILNGAPSADMTAVINLIDNQTPDAQKAALDQLHGSLLANAIMSVSFNTGRRNLYGRITPRDYKDTCLECSSVPVLWAQGFGAQDTLKADSNSPGDFKSKGYGVQAGMDLSNTDVFTGGLFVGYSDHNITQAYDKASMKNYSAGLYGGWFGDKWDVKSSVSAGMQNFDTTRNIVFAGRTARAKFSTQNLNADAQAEYKIPTESALIFKPFIGLRGGIVRNGGFNETGADSVNLYVDGDTYFNASAFGGLGLEEKLDKFRWRGDVHVNAVAIGNKNTLASAFAENTGVKMDIYSAEQGVLTYGAALGAEYELFRPLSLYANVSADMGSGYKSYYGNVGLNWKFCCGKKDACALETPKPEPAPAPAPVVTPAPPAPAPSAEPVAAKTFVIKNTHFATNKANLSPQFKYYLDTIIPELQNYNIIVEGHTDSTGKDTLNKRLSQSRAQSVAGYLIQQGIDPYKVRAIGYGKSRPVATNATAQGRAENRRIEIKLINPDTK